MKLVAAVVVLFTAGPALAGLDLEIEILDREVEFEASITYVVRFVNRGAEEVRFFEPLHAGTNTFPDVRLVKTGDGRELRPYDSPFQSMVARGLQGKVVRLGPGDTKEYRYERSRFMTVDRRTQKADWLEPRNLPDGEYELRATYVRRDDRLPHNVGGFDVEPKRVPGIFTGTLTAEPVRFVVRPPNRPHVRISVPERGTTGVVISFTNPTQKDLAFAGAARFELGSKMYGSAVAPIGDEAMDVKVPAGQTIERRVDLRDLAWRREEKGLGPPEGLGSIVPEGLCHLLFVLESNGPPAGHAIWVSIPTVPQRGLENLTVTAALIPSVRVVAGKPVRLTVHVENRGESDVGLVHRLAFPRELVIRIEDATGKRRSIVSSTGKARGGIGGLRPRGENACKLAHGLSWDRDRFEEMPALTRKDFIWIESQAGILKEVDLTGLLATGLTPGQYRITAGYRNLETGAHLGFAKGHRPGTGVVWSKPVTLIVE